MKLNEKGNYYHESQRGTKAFVFRKKDDYGTPLEEWVGMLVSPTGFTTHLDRAYNCPTAARLALYLYRIKNTKT